MKRFDLLDEFSTVTTPNLAIEPRKKKSTKLIWRGLSVRKASFVGLVAALLVVWLV